MASASQPSFLSLPLEVRQVIYDFCYCTPLTSSRSELTPVSKPNHEPASQPTHRREDGTVLELREIAAKCQSPKCHLSLLSVCRQIRNEYFPIFAAHHVFSFSDPLVFANEYLSYNPPHRYSSIRHLALVWNPPERKCSCEVVSACHVHGLKDPDANRDMRNFIRLIDIYPELLRHVESIRFDLNFPFAGSELFKNVVVLLEAMNHGSATTGEEMRRYLVVPYARLGYYRKPTTVSISVVPNDLWTRSIDGATLIHEPCHDCARDQGLFDRDCSKHFVDWRDMKQFLPALQQGRLYPHQTILPVGGDDADPYLSSAKNWKVLFDVNPTTKGAWEIGMKDMKMWKGNKSKSRQRGRK